MSSEHRVSDNSRRPEDSPAAWFAVLETARQANDFELAATARRELERLGVKVFYEPAGERAAGDSDAERGVDS